MSNRRFFVIIAASAILAACASTTVDTSTSTFNESKYAVDLDNCRGGTVLDVALNGLGSAAIGSAYGALNGVQLGVLSGNSSEGAAIGAIVGGVIGVVVGAYEPIQEQEQSVARCLSGKGYVLGS